MSEFIYKQLIVWQKSIYLLKQVYGLVKILPKEEDYNLKLQLRRAALSVPSNIAEGSGRFSLKDKKRFYEIARSSLIEIDSQLEAGIALEYISKEDCLDINNTAIEISKMLSKMISNCK